MKILLKMSIYFSIMTAVILLLRLLFKKKLSKKTFKLLWLLAALRSIIPIFVPVHIGAIQNKYLDTIYTEYLPINVKPELSDISLATAEVTSSINIIGVFSIIWIIGFLLTMTLFAAAYIRGVRKYRAAQEIQEAELSNIVKSFKLFRRIRIKESDTTESFLTYGIIKPIIICPTRLYEKYDKKQITYALYHELIHIKNFDAIYKLLIITSVCLHWFNPLIWVMFKLSSRDIELACDEKLLEIFTNVNYDYANTLINVSENQNSAYLFSGFGKNAIEERIEFIMKFKKPAFASICAAVAAVTCTAVVFSFAIEPNAQENIVVPSSDNDLYSAVTVPYDIDSDEEAASEVLSDGENDSAASEVTIKLPPNGNHGVIRKIPENEYKYGLEAVRVLESYFEGKENFSYPIDSKNNDSYFYFGAFNIPAEKGENIYAMLDGTVIYADLHFPFGNAVIIDHGDQNLWIYAHCNDLCVSEGDKVNAGDVIAHVGSTGATAEDLLYIYKY